MHVMQHESTYKMVSAGKRLTAFILNPAFLGMYSFLILVENKN